MSDERRTDDALWHSLLGEPVDAPPSQDEAEQPAPAEPEREPARVGRSLTRLGTAALVVAGLAAVMLVAARGIGALRASADRRAQIGEEASAPGRAGEGLTEVTGVRFLTPRGPLELYGKRRRGAPGITPARAASYFSTALRAYFVTGRGPGVSIDPTPAQVQWAAAHGGELVGDQIVRYEGQTADTLLGLVMFAADRRMKCLGQGKDNLTGEPVSATVAGVQSEYDLRGAGGGSGAPRWTRYWFVPDSCAVRVSDDGSTFGVSASLRVEVRGMQANAAGVLQDAAGTADAASLSFAEQFGQHYRELERADPVYHDLLLAARMSAIAQAVQTRLVDDDTGNDPAVDAGYWCWHGDTAVTRTPRGTPGLNTSREYPAKGATVVIRLAGGVDLTAESPEVGALRGRPSGEAVRAPATGAAPAVQLGDLDGPATLSPVAAQRAQLRLTPCEGMDPAPRLLVGDIVPGRFPDGTVVQAPRSLVLAFAEDRPSVVFPRLVQTRIEGGGVVDYHFPSADGAWRAAVTADGSFAVTGPDWSATFDRAGHALDAPAPDGSRLRMSWVGDRLASWQVGDQPVHRVRLSGDGTVEAIDGLAAGELAEARATAAGAARSVDRLPVITIKRLPRGAMRVEYAGGSADLSEGTLEAACRGDREAGAAVRQALPQLGDGGEVLALADRGDMDGPRSLELALALAGGGPRVLAAENLSRAQGNLSHGLAVREAQAWVHRDSLTSDQVTALTDPTNGLLALGVEQWRLPVAGEAGRADASADTIVLIGHRVTEVGGTCAFDQWVRSNLAGGMLAGRKLVLAACGDESLGELVSELMSAGDALRPRCIGAFPAQVDARVVRELLRAMDARTPGSGAPVADFADWFDGALRDALSSLAAPAGEPKAGSAPEFLGEGAGKSPLAAELAKLVRYRTLCVGWLS